ncbi:DUF4365 domain-containing protein [Paenibacillus sp. V4I7]|uniref:DUF4365 domain-containing protein n=1 Tax=Paenibacillus sp. V4I7 TaxID=3042307 RepID=UPI00277E31FF|nr:DUF4365 domain-containing protein [Paenibacillus sp. V4I7]MDQ0902748.1 hypothetical protein [Paenibacillus sp. V4I7]
MTDLPHYSGPTEEIGLMLVNNIVTTQIGWIFREQPKKDFGIDAHIEIVGDSLVTGKLIAAQIKTGQSYLRERTNNGYLYRGKMKHLNYWKNHSLPVILILCDDIEGESYWVQITDDNAIVLENHWAIRVPFTQQLNISSKRKLELIAGNQTDYEKRLHSLVLARPWMEELSKGNSVILESEEWVNKTSGRGSITLKIIDSQTNKETTALNYPMIFLGLVSYEEAFKKLFPWAIISIDEDFYLQYDEDDYSMEEEGWDSEEDRLPLIRPYENPSGEVARYRLKFSLNQTGKAFLLLDDYLKSGIINEEVTTREDNERYFDEEEWDEVDRRIDREDPDRKNY